VAFHSHDKTIKSERTAQNQSVLVTNAETERAAGRDTESRRRPACPPGVSGHSSPENLEK
jgi:hypothetical protein